jgi:hypothetical protein
MTPICGIPSDYSTSDGGNCDIDLETIKFPKKRLTKQISVSSDSKDNAQIEDTALREDADRFSMRKYSFRHSLRRVLTSSKCPNALIAPVHGGKPISPKPSLKNSNPSSDQPIENIHEEDKSDNVE